MLSKYILHFRITGSIFKVSPQIGRYWNTAKFGKSPKYGLFYTFIDQIFYKIYFIYKIR